MKPVDFVGQNVVFAKDQPEYIPLPALVMPSGEVITCWALSDKDIEEIIKTKRLWFSQLTFGQALQPQRPSATRPFEFVKESKDARK